MDDVDRNIQRQDELYDQLLASPAVDLTGLVSPNGVGAVKSRGEQLWSLGVSFNAWRISGGPVRTESLTIRRRVTDEELDQFQTAIDAETVIRVRARVAEDNVFGSVQAHLDEYVERVDNDTELNARLEELQQPITHNDDQFGTLTFDRRYGWYAASAKWAGDTIDLTLKAEHSDEVEPCLKVARDLWSEESSWKARVENYAVQELLPLKNDLWLDDDESEVSSEEFKSRMTLQAISIYPDSTFEFWHEDGDLFWGHSIKVSGNLSDGPTDADIPG